MIKFKAKIQTIYDMDDSIAYRGVKVPKLTASHCDMAAFRKHPKYGGFANSNMFPGILARIAKEKGLKNFIRLDAIPEGVKIDMSGFLAVVTIENV